MLALLAPIALLSACMVLPQSRGLVLHVAPGGAADADGTRNRPFASLEAARDRVRTLRAENTPPPAGITVLIHGGRYPVTNTFTLGRGDGGVEWRSARGETPVFSGGLRLERFTPVADAALRARLPAVAADRVVQCDLNAHGLTNLPPLAFGGFGSGRGFRTHPAPELFFNGRALARAGWPDTGFATVARVPTNDAPVTIHGQRGSKAGRFGFDDPRLARWAGEDDLWL
jgi:hypothetical protein